MKVKYVVFSYDSTLEKQLNDLICNIDTSPIICTSPFEKSSYLGVKFSSGEEEFQIYIQEIYDQFKDYTNYIIQKKSGYPKSYDDLESTLAQFLVKYKSAHSRFMESTLRKEWKHKAAHDFIPNPKKDKNISEQVKYTRLAYNYFYKMSSIQLFFIGEVILYLSQQLNPFKKTNQDIPQSKNIALKEESKPVYCFKISKQKSLTSHIILPKIHKGLKGLGYIDCTLPDFKRLFKNYNDKKPTLTPPAIIWKCEHYNHLGYFIKCLIFSKFISYSKLPSNNKIALNLFHNGKVGNPYSTKGKRYGGRLNPIDKAKIDTIIKDSGLMPKKTTIQF